MVACTLRQFVVSLYVCQQFPFDCMPVALFTSTLSYSVIMQTLQSSILWTTGFYRLYILYTSIAFLHNCIKRTYDKSVNLNDLNYNDTRLTLIHNCIKRTCDEWINLNHNTIQYIFFQPVVYDVISFINTLLLYTLSQ